MAVNFNVEPYFDDYSEDKKFHRILFRPGYSVQARELTQLQTILQKQIERMGNHLFKQGAMVIPGQISYDEKLKYVKLSSKYNNVETSSFISKLVGQRVVGLDSGVEAIIVQSEAATSSDPNMIFVKYVKAGQDVLVDEGEQKTFIAGEPLKTIAELELEEYLFQVQSTNTNINPAFGESTAASIERGVYYINGFFVVVEAQTVVLDKFSKKPSYKVGLQITDSFIEPEDDETLLDNAQDSYNYAAPGAHRYAIDATLIKRSLTSTDTEDFIELMRVVKGKIQNIVNRTEYAVLADTLARRTFDESGNYTIRNFGIEVREYRNNYRGNWAPGVAYLVGDVAVHNGSKYVARNSAVSSNSVDLLSDSSVVWEQDSNAALNRGIYTPDLTVTEPVLDVSGNPTFNYDLDGSILSQIFSTRNATVADNQKWDGKLAVGMEAGKAYVYGYEIEKLGTTYVEVDKAREYTSVENQLLGVEYGNYVLVKNVNYAPNINGLPEVKIYNGYTGTAGAIAPSAVEVGSARVRGFEYHSGSGSSTLYKLFLFDLRMYSGYTFNTSAKQFRAAGASNALSFTADAAVEEEVLSGAITFTASGTTTTIVGVNTRFLTDFEVGDFIFLDSAPRRITAITDNLNMSISTGVASQNGTPVIKCKSLLIDANNVSVILPLPNYAVKTVSELSYTIRQAFTATASVAGVITIVVSGGNEFTSTTDTSNYLLFAANGDRVVPTSATRSANNLTVEFAVNVSYANQAFLILATVQKEKTIGLKTKTLSTNTVTLTNKSAVSTPRIYLGKADGVRLKSVMMAQGFAFGSTPASSDYTKDITSWYFFRDGQTSSYYGTAYISRSIYRPAPTAPIKITFEYYDHSTGDFFTADSYPNYKTIPSFQGASLRDCIDFRPRVDDAFTAAVVFSGSNDFVPRFAQDMLISYQYYLAKNVKIALSKNGDFKAVYGASSLTPRDPSDSSDGMTLYKLQLEPYTFATTSDSVVVSKIDNRRYTMRDIAEIDKRLNTLEYYTALSLLEQKTASMLIQDEDGFNRFKNGFIVDNFKSQAVGDAQSSDYSCAIDFENGILRPFFSMKNINLVETYSNNVDRQNNANYTLTGDIISLPYTHKEIITQPLASDTINVNPFAVFTFVGTAEITPPFDRWFEVNRRPDIIVSVQDNYSAVKYLAERTGVLGTVWNAWQTQWAGKSVISVKSTGKVLERRGGNYKVQDEIITAVTEGQQRAGITTTIQETFQDKTIDDKVLSVAAIPYIRSRNILVQCKNLKPKARFWPYFDKQDIAEYCTPASKLTLTRSTMTSIDFDCSTNVGSQYKDPARLRGNNVDFAVNIGDVVYVSQRSSVNYTSSNSPATAVVVAFGDKKLVSGVVYQDVYVVNEKGSFASNDQVTGTISSATGSVSSYTKKTQTESLITDELGQVQFLFDIPNSDAVRFRAGKKELALLDVSTYDLITSDSSVTTEYEAQGYIETRQASVERIRNAVVKTEAVSENRTINYNAVSYGSHWVDPLAQTFLIDAYPDGTPTGNVSANVPSGGCFITKVDLYFATKDSTLPVTVQIREVVNGYPGRGVLPFAQATLNASQVNTSADSSVATTFTFASPVYVANQSEYCIVILTNSINYKVWISQLGKVDKLTSTIIDKQPYAGVLFKSQNASTWTADQTQDLKFKLHRAVFKTGTIGSVEFENAVIEEENLEFDPLQFTNGSNKVRVFMRNHGMTDGSKITLTTPAIAATGTITISGTSVTGVGTQFLTEMSAGTALYSSSGTLLGVVSSVESTTALTLAASPTPVNVSAGTFITYRSPLNGVQANNIYKQHIVTKANELDSFIITVDSSATSTGFNGGNSVFAAGNAMFDSVQPAIFLQSFTNTQVTSYFKGTSGKSIDGFQVPYMADANWSPVTINETNDMPDTYVVANNDNALTPLELGGAYSSTALNLSSKSGQVNSAVVKMDIVSNIDTLSPMIDVRSSNLILVSNKINSTSNEINIDPIDNRTILSAATGVTFSGTTVSIADVSDNRASAATLRSGQYIVITGSTSGTKTVLLTNVAQDGSTLEADQTISGIVGNVTIVAKDRFFSEITPFGSSSFSKYVTRRINLVNDSTFLKIMYAASVPLESDVEVYYKLGLVGNTEDFSLVEYAKASVTHVKSNDGVFRDVEIDIPDLQSFNALSLKIVMKSTNSTKVPEIRDLRIIACA